MRYTSGRTIDQEILLILFEQTDRILFRLQFPVDSPKPHLL